jgi:hypothetical protein
MTSAVLLWLVLTVLSTLAARGAAQATAQPVGSPTAVPSAAPTSSPTNAPLENKVNTGAVGAALGALGFVAAVGIAVVRRSQGAVAGQETSKTSPDSGQSSSGGSLARPLHKGSVASSVAISVPGSSYGGGALSGRDLSVYLPRRAGAAGPGAAAPASSAMAMSALATGLKRGRATLRTLQSGVRAMPTDEFFRMFATQPASSAEVTPVRASPEEPARANKLSPSPMRTSPVMARASPSAAPVSSWSPAMASYGPVPGVQSPAVASYGPVPGVQPKLRITAIDLDNARGKDLATYL